MTNVLGRIQGRGALAWVALGAFLLLPVWLSGFSLFLLSLAGTYVLAAVGLNLLKGYCGPISAGHGALMAIGGYATAILMVDHGWSFWPAAVVAVVAAGVAGGLVALPSFRISAWYFALLTLAMALVVEGGLGEFSGLTHGHGGIVGIQPPEFFGRVLDTQGLYYLVLVLNAVGLLLLARILASRFGRAMLGVRDAPAVARASGISTAGTTVWAFVLSAAYAGLGGALYAVLKQVLTPDDFDFHLSITLLIYVVLGGLGRLWGPVLGVGLFFWLPQRVEWLAEYRLLALGVLLLAVSVAAPEGLMGLLASATKRLRRSPTEPAAVQSTTAASGERHRPPGSQVDGARLDVRSVSKHFAGVRAIDDLSMVVEAGEVHGLIGSNGSGKTTLLNIVSGVYAPDGGTVRVGEEDITGLKSHIVARRGVARTFQTPALILRLDAVENVLLGADNVAQQHVLGEVFGLPTARQEKEALREEANAWLDFVGLGGTRHTRADQLPHGQQRLVELARAMMVRPRLLLLDEPAAGLSMTELDHLERCLLQIRGLGVTTVVVEHHLDLVRGVASAVTILDQGRVLATGAPDVVLESPEVRATYMGAGS